uniref:Uncharacterized protein n=1 Tax=Anopheles farauti TaxID=69004 RepID=A0A182PZG2_9DIPT
MTAFLTVQAKEMPSFMALPSIPVLADPLRDDLGLGFTSAIGPTELRGGSDSSTAMKYTTFESYEARSIQSSIRVRFIYGEPEFFTSSKLGLGLNFAWMSSIISIITAQSV